MTQTNLIFWGNNQHSLLSTATSKNFPKPSQTSLPFQLKDLSASEKHIVFITQDGLLFTYGLNLDGRLGVGGKPDLRSELSNPVKVKLPAAGLKVKCGFSHTCVQLSNDQLYSWGLGDYGALGTGEFKSRGTPGKVLVKGRISNFSCGAMHSGFVDSEGNTYTCGSNEYGQLGVNRPEKIATPILVSFGQKVKQVQCGVFYTLLLTTKGQVYGMGNNKYGQLGIGHKVNECHPTLIRELEGITTIAAGYHSGALDSEGSLYIWGSGSFGQLLKPKKFVVGVPFDRIFIRGFFGVGVSTRQQKVFAWGNNTYGELGRGDYDSAKEPIQVADLTNIRFSGFACGVNFFLAATKDNLTIKEHISGSATERNRYNYMPQSRRSPYHGSSLQPLHFQPSTMREQERLRSAERYNRTPTRRNQALEEQARSRSRSRGEEYEARDLIAQEIRRSRSRQNGNYQELFISLSADYQALLARFKAMEDHLELKNRSLITQKQEITMIFKEENQLLRQQNEILKRDLLVSREASRDALSRSRNIYENRQQSEAAKDLKTLKDQFRLTIKQMEALQEELVSKDLQLRALKINEDREIRSQVQGKQLRIARQELKIANRQLAETEEELASKTIEVRTLRQKRLGGDVHDNYEQTREKLNDLTKRNKQLKEELRNASRKYDLLEEEIAIKSLQLKEQKHKRQSIETQVKQENQILTQEIAYLNKDLKVTKEELKITLKRIDEIEEELVSKNMELKDSKHKKILYEGSSDIKSEVQNQREQIMLLNKENKNLKQERRLNNHKLNEYERQLDLKITEAKDFKRKLTYKDQECDLLKEQSQMLSKDVATLKDELKKTLRDLEEMSDMHQDANSLKDATRLLNEKQRFIGELNGNHKTVEEKLYREIAASEQEKIKLVEMCQRATYERNKFEDALKASEDSIALLEKQYNMQITGSMGSLAKMKQLQELNDIRSGQLKQIIEEEHKKHENIYSEAEMANVRLEEVIEEKKELFKMIEQMKSKQEQSQKVYQDKIIEAENVSGQTQERMEQLQVEIAYEKDYHGKCEDSIRDLTEQRDKACREIEVAKQNLDKDKEKIKELNFEVDKAKTLKKEVEVLSLQLERVQASTRDYRKEIEQILLQKEEILKELRGDLQKKQNESEKWQEKYDTQTAALKGEVKDLQNKLTSKNKECNDLRKQIQRRLSDIDILKDTIEKLNRKLAFKTQQFEKQIKEHEKTTEQFNHLRREYTKLRSEKEQVENRNEELINEKEILEQKIVQKKREVELLQGEAKNLQSMIENLKKQNQIAKKDLEESNWALEESRRINDELAKANKEFAENQEQFTTKISELEGRLFELQDENKSYTPRYEALLLRNKELDDRNRDLSQMINKAIEIQAEAYKSNILKEVQINTGEIISQMKQEQEYKPRTRRRQVITPKEVDASETENMHSTPGLMSKVKEEPYNKLMQEKISVHKKRVSDSAQKLAGILELGGGQGEGRSFERSTGVRREEDYEKINSQMQSLNQQKQQFMEKINTFAQKLKIL